LIKRNFIKRWIILLFISIVILPNIIGENNYYINSLQIKNTFITKNYREPYEKLNESCWPMFHHDNYHTGRSPFGVKGSWPLTKWKFLMDGWTISSPAIDEQGILYIGAEDLHKSFFAVYSNGSKKFQYDAGDWVDSSPTIGSDGTIYFGSGNNYLNALLPNGTIKWVYYIGWSFSSPTIDLNGTIYIGSHDHYLYAINPNGTQRWRFETGNPVLSSPAIDDKGIIYVGSHDHYLYAIYPNGTLKWKYQTTGELKSSPSIGVDGSIYICSWDRYLYAIDSNGTLKWKFDTGDATETTPAIAEDGTIYVGTYNGKIFSITPAGIENWYYQTNGEIYSSPAIDKYGIIYSGSDDGYLYVLNPNGILRWKFHAGNHMSSSPIIGQDGTIYITGQFSASDSIAYSSLYAIEQIDDTAPSIPIITGTEDGKVRHKYDYTIISTDPEEDNISYYIDWGDGKTTDWIGPYDSGEEIIQSHTWLIRGSYKVKVKARDGHGMESDWGTLSVTMPYEPHFLFFERIFERFPHTFPFLRYIL
jgi:outer membrane protein assembly factor BamB